MAKPQVFETRFDVPPDYAYAWLTDFRPDDMAMADPKRAPTIRVSRQGGKIVREFSMMGMDFRTETTLETPTRWTTESTIHRKGTLFARGHVVETVREVPGGTLHRAEVGGEPVTLLAKLMNPVFNVANKANLNKLFREAKRRMEEQHKAGKAATA